MATEAQRRDTFMQLWTSTQKTLTQTVDTPKLDVSSAPSERTAPKTPQASSLRPVNIPSTGSAPTLGFKADRQKVARIILMAAAIDAVAVVIRNAKQPPVKAQVGGHTITIPASMRSYAGVVVMAGVALFVNELDAEAGAVFAALMVIAALASTDIFAVLGGIVAPGAAKAHPTANAPSPSSVPNIATPGGVVTGPDGSTFYTGPTGSKLVPVGGGNYSIEPLGPNPGTVVS